MDLSEFVHKSNQLGFIKSAAPKLFHRFLSQLALANRNSPDGFSSLGLQNAHMGRFGKSLGLDRGVGKLDDFLGKSHPGFDPASMRRVAEGGPLPMVQRARGGVSTKVAR